MFELVQAHSALEGALTDLQPLHGGVDKSGEGPDGGRVQATRSARASADTGESEGELKVKGAGNAVVRTVPHVDREEAENEEYADEDHHDKGHAFVNG